MFRPGPNASARSFTSAASQELRREWIFGIGRRGFLALDAGNDRPTIGQVLALDLGHCAVAQPDAHRYRAHVLSLQRPDDATVDSSGRLVSLYSGLPALIDFRSVLIGLLERFAENGRNLLGLGLPVQGGVGYQQDIAEVLQLELHIGSQVRQQTFVRVVGDDFHGVGDHVLGHGSIQPHFAHRTLEGFTGEGIHGEGHRLAGMNLADIGFIDRNPDLHAGQILGNQKQTGSVEARHYGLTDVDTPVDDDPFDR